MRRNSVVLIGCGRMGRAITKMLLQEEKQENLSIDIFLYDPFKEAEETCMLECQELFSRKLAHPLREVHTASDWEKIDRLMVKARGEQELTRELSKLMKAPLASVQPRLLLNAATYFAHRIYIPLAIELGCDYIDLGQGIPAPEERQTYEAAIRKSKTPSRLVHESGLAPGLANVLAANLYNLALAQSSNGRVHSVQMRCGGLPQNTEKSGDLHYGPVFSPDGLLYEYEAEARSIRDGAVVIGTTFDNPDHWENSTPQHTPYGCAPFLVETPTIRMLLEDRIQSKFLEYQDDQMYLTGLQARPTADGTSQMTSDERYRVTIDNLEYKTFRFKPHFETWSRMQEEGTLEVLLDRWRLKMDEPHVSGYPDLVMLRVWAQTSTDSEHLSTELLVLHDDVDVDESNAFSAMAHLTCWPTVLLAVALLQYPPGTSSSKRPKLFQAPEAMVGSQRSVESLLEEGGITLPYDILDGKTMLEMLDDDHRIPLRDVRYPPPWRTSDN